MAASSKVSAVFTSDASGLELGIKRAQKALRDLKAETGGLRTSMLSLTKAVSLNTFVTLGKVAGAAISKFSAQVSSAISDATSLGEELSKSAQIFGANAGEIEKFANSAASLGFTKVAALQAAGSFGNMFTAMKLSSDKSAEMSLTFTKLAADMASFNNTSVDDAVNALGAALRGESEPIRRFGVLLDDATLRAKAFELGLTKTATDAMTPAIKAQAAYAAILEQTSKAQGDFARTSGGLANIGRVMQAQVGNLAIELGGIFVPILESFAGAVNSILAGIGPIVSQAAATLIDGWNAVEPLVMETFWNATELFARVIDFAASIIGPVFGLFQAAIGAFASLLPDWGTTLEYWGVAVEVFQRAISLLEGVVSGFMAAWRYVASGLATAVKGALSAAAWLTEKLGGDASRLREMASSADELSSSMWEAANVFAENSGEKMANAFSSNFKPTELGKKATDALANGMEGGFESFAEKARAGWSKAQKATADAGNKMAEAATSAATSASSAWDNIPTGYAATVNSVTEKVVSVALDAVDAIARESSVLSGTSGASSLIAGLINKTTSGYEKRQLAAAEKTAAILEDLRQQGYEDSLVVDLA